MQIEAHFLESEAPLSTTPDEFSQRRHLGELPTHGLSGLRLRYSDLGRVYDYALTTQIVSRERAGRMRQVDLGALKPLHEPPRGGRKPDKGLAPVFYGHGDVTHDETLKLVKAVRDVRGLGRNVVLQALGAHPLILLKNHDPEMDLVRCHRGEYVSSIRYPVKGLFTKKPLK